MLVLFAPRDRDVIDPIAIYVYILRHLFTYQSLKLGLYTPRDREFITASPYLFTYQVSCLYI